MLEWDDTKRAKVLRERNIDFGDLESVFHDPQALVFEDESSADEERSVVVGMDDTGCLVTVVFTHREPNIRIITAWKATEQEIEEYGK